MLAAAAAPYCQRAGYHAVFVVAAVWSPCVELAPPLAMCSDDLTPFLVDLPDYVFVGLAPALSLPFLLSTSERELCSTESSPAPASRLISSVTFPYLPLCVIVIYDCPTLSRLGGSRRGKPTFIILITIMTIETVYRLRTRIHRL
jgi:hypothetical protein